MEQRPRIVMGVGASADGKLALRRDEILMREPSSSLWAGLAPEPAETVPYDVIETLRRLYGCNAVLEGSGSLVPAGEVSAPLPPFGGDPGPLYQHHLPADVLARPSPPRMWFVAVDGSGRVRWEEDHADWDILVLVCRATPADYLAYLRERGICYLVAGQERVDLPEAVRLMRAEVGIACLLSTAGGELNGALHRAGLIDEVFLSLFPGLVGGRDTPTILDGDRLPSGVAPTRLSLLSVQTDTAGLVRLHYAVQRS